MVLATIQWLRERRKRALWSCTSKTFELSPSWDSILIVLHHRIHLVILINLDWIEKAPRVAWNPWKTPTSFRQIVFPLITFLLLMPKSFHQFHRKSQPALSFIKLALAASQEETSTLTLRHHRRRRKISLSSLLTLFSPPSSRNRQVDFISHRHKHSVCINECLSDGDKTESEHFSH